ncbi:MAG TPA: aspartate aminotransferase family protein [Polyangia bacterium]|nr:aspartate aminotransferase family protein [Polyangia bacterium]
MTRKFAHVSTPLPGPKSRAIAAREEPYLAPGIQQISQLAGLALEGGSGAVVVDADGNRILDFNAGIGVASIGHGHPALADALATQARKITSGSYASEARASLLERIAQQTSKIGSGKLTRTMLYSGGAEAVESALRLARAHTGKHEAIAFWGAFHGKTTGALALMGSDFKHGLGPLPPGNFLTPWGDLEMLERTIKLSTTGRLAAIIAEPIQGTAGNILPPPGFLAGVRELAHEHGALFIADEMITGWGRTGRMFAQELYGVEADIMTFGKGVAAGFPVAGLVTTDAILADADPWSRPSFSSSSYGGSPLAAAACDAVTRLIVDDRLDQNAARIGEVLLGELHRLRKFPFVGEVRGQGLLCAIDLVDRHSGPKTRAPLAKNDCVQLFRGCLERGLLTMAYAPRVRINPPLVISEAEAREGVDILEEAMTALRV